MGPDSVVEGISKIIRPGGHTRAVNARTIHTDPTNLNTQKTDNKRRNKIRKVKAVKVELDLSSKKMVVPR